MASYLPPGKQQFPDKNGDPLAGGKVYFYIPGTTSPKDTYQDAGQTILNSNPITLDAAGEAIIFGTGVYRQVVQDALGNLIWDQITQDPGSQSQGQIQTLTASGQTILPTTAIALINPVSAGAGTYLLPATPTSSTPIWVKGAKGDESENNQTINGNGHTIDGNTSFLLDVNYQSAGFSFNGFEWSVL